MTLAKRKLGRTGLDVTVLGFGGAPLGDLYRHARRCNGDCHRRGRGPRRHHAVRHRAALRPGHRRASLRHRAAAPAARAASRCRPRSVGCWCRRRSGRNKSTRYVGGLAFDVVHDYGYDAHHALDRALAAALRPRPRSTSLLIHDADAWSHGPEKGRALLSRSHGGRLQALDKLRARRHHQGHRHRPQRSGLRRPLPARRRLRLHAAGRPLFAARAAGAGRGPAARRSKKQVGVMLGGVFNSGILATGADAGRQVQLRRRAAGDPGQGAPDRARSATRMASSLPTAAMHFCLGHPAVASLVLGAVKPDEVRAQRRGACRRTCRRRCGPTSRARACSTTPRRRRHEGTPCRSTRTSISGASTRGDYGWLTPALAPIYRDFCRTISRRSSRRHGIARTILVQAAPTRRRDRVSARHRGARRRSSPASSAGSISPRPMRRSRSPAGRRPTARRPAADGAGHRRRRLAAARRSRAGDRGDDRRMISCSMHWCCRGICRALRGSSSAIPTLRVVDRSRRQAAISRRGSSSPGATTCARSRPPERRLQAVGPRHRGRARIGRAEDVRPYCDAAAASCSGRIACCGAATGRWSNLAGGYDAGATLTADGAARPRPAERAAVLGGNAAAPLSRPRRRAER